MEATPLLRTEAGAASPCYLRSKGADVDPKDARAVSLAGSQHGLLTRMQAAQLGFGPSAIRHRLDSGRWMHAQRGVYRLVGAPMTWLQRVLASCLALDAIASHRTAAVLWGIDGFRPGRPEVSICQRRRVEQPDAHVHRSTQLALANGTKRQGIPVTGLARTLLDLGAVVSTRQVELAIDDCRRDHRVQWPDLFETLVLHSRRGRNGCGPLRAVLDERYGEKAVPGSRFNRMVERLLVDAGLPAPVLEHTVTRADGVFAGRVDLAYPSHQVAIELDGKATHLDADAFEHDHQRMNELRLAGWFVLAFTWRFYRECPDQLVSQVAAALRSASEEA